MPESPPNRTNRTNATDGVSPRSLRPSSPSHPETFLPPHGGYEDLLSFQKARIIYDATVRFCDQTARGREESLAGDSRGGVDA